MRNRIVFALGCFVLATEGLADVRWPLVTMREACSPGCAEVMREIVRLHGRHPGSLDEIWLSGNGVFTDEKTVRDLSELAGLRDDFSKAGIVLGFQQGFTLGHGSLEASGILPEELKDVHRYPDDAWAVGRKGDRLEMLCARSPAVWEHEAHYIEQLVRVLHPADLWLDDDLRLGNCKLDACFCPRCIEAFNREEGENVTREELVERIFVRPGTDPIRTKWFRFNDRSCALYAAAVRRALDKADPNCRLGLQITNPSFYYSGIVRSALYKAASGDGRHPIGIRIPGGMYSEWDHPRSLIESLFDVMKAIADARREAPGAIGSFSFETENWTREVVNKSAEAILRQSALSFAVGCDATTMYSYWQNRAEPLELVGEFADMLADWRPYYEKLAEIAKRTSPCGVAFRPDAGVYDRLPDILKERPDAYGEWMACGFKGYDQDNSKLAVHGIPVVPFGAGEVAVLTKAEFGSARKPGMYAMTTAEADGLRDLLDRRSGNRMPVRVAKAHALVVYPRVDGEGRLVSATFFNVSIGTARAIPVFLRRPAGRRFVWWQETAKPVDLQTTAGKLPDECCLTLPDIPGYTMATVTVETEENGKIARWTRK